MRLKSLVTGLAILLFAASAGARDSASSAPASALPAVQPAGRPAVGIALEGGSALGLAHIGILQWLEENHVPIDRLAGTSMGSLVGALYATGHTPAEMRALAGSDAFTRVFALQAPYADVSFRRRQDRREIPQALSVGLRHHVALRNALLADQGVNEFLATNLLDANRQELDFDGLMIPFRCMATDLNTLEPVSFASGPLPAAVRASISLPGVFPPVKALNGHFLVDGGILDNLPTDVLKRDLHAGVIIAVRIEDALLADADTGSIVGVLNRAFSAGIVQNAARSELLADVVVRVPVGSFAGTDYGRANELVDAGYKAAEATRAALLRYALDDVGWRAYLADRESRRRPAPGTLREVRVEGASAGAMRRARLDLKPLEGRPIAAAAVLDALKGVQSGGGIAATWETFSAQPAAADTGLLIHLTPDRIGPPYLLVGPEVSASTSNITRGELTLRLVDQNLGGFGSEFRATARIGYMTELGAEYYRLLTPQGYFVEPHAGIVRQPVYLWANQKRIAERFEESLAAGLEAGRTFSNQVQASVVWRAEDTRWSLQTGSGGGPDLHGAAQTGLLQLNIDRTAASVVSPSGYRLMASAGALYHAVGSDNAPVVHLSFGATRSWKEINILGMGTEINSYLRARVAEPYRFTLGGPLHLSASSFDEFRGTDTWLARAGLLHRIAGLPTGLGHGLYGVVAYEAGEVWSPEARATLRQDGVTGLVANTPLGLITFGVSVGDAGHRKVFVTIGRWF